MAYNQNCKSKNARDLSLFKEDESLGTREGQEQRKIIDF